ncbi:hypothetical protein PIB30_074075 [Stylosanthes scabra]|uniref:Uncharacterized protein n=1 Tax=Stylosanthes scabra TaxID=79078 RepID=A0ABU6US17_9FABA|nr:hypothetical protein [Stylosanthes scabra]
MASQTKNNNHEQVKIIEECKVSPPQGSLPSTTTILPLTFFDIAWFLSHPINRIFFYDFPYSTNHFLQSTLPPLKYSLSLSLQHFFPFASNLIVPPTPNLPFIRFIHGVDSLSLTIAESKADFSLLVSDSPQDVTLLHPFVPSLPPKLTLEDGTHVMPLMAIQVTVLPNSGFAICLTFCHVAADGNSLHQFIKFWANLCKQIVTRDGGGESSSFLSLPFLDRGIVKDPKGLKHVYMEGVRDLMRKSNNNDMMNSHHQVVPIEDIMVRATLVLNHSQVEKLKKFVSLKYRDTCDSNNNTLLHMSTFVVTCSLIWVCMMQSEQQTQDDDDDKDFDKVCCLIILADYRGRSEFSIPSNYFGNCLLSVYVRIKRGDLVGENNNYYGIFEAARGIEREIRNLRNDALTTVESFISDTRASNECYSRIVVAGSPKLGVYETDFGWGKPKKSAAVHVESAGAFSLSDCRNNEGAVECPDLGSKDPNLNPK